MRKHFPLCIWAFLVFLVSCAGHPSRDPNFTYLDEVKFSKKGELSYVGLFTTHPIQGFFADKLKEPLALTINLDGCYISEPRLPKKFKDSPIKSIEVKPIEIDGRPASQAIIYLSQDSDFTLKQTEYGLRVDLMPLSSPEVAQEVSKPATPTLEQSPESDIEPKEQETMAKTEEKVAEAAKEDIKEQKQTEAETEAPLLPEESPALEPAPEISKKILQSITRTSLPNNQERVTLVCSEAVDLQKTILDRELIIELKGTKVGEAVSAMTIDEEESYLRTITTNTSDDPFPSTKINLIFKDSIVPEVTQNANIIHIDYTKPRIAKSLEEQDGGIDFGNYLNSPSKLPGRPLSIQTKDADIHDILRLLSETSDYNMIVGKDVAGKVSVRLIKVPWDEALIAILQAHQLGFVKQGNILRIASLSSLKEEKEKASQALQAKDEFEALQILFLPLNNRKATDLTKHLYPILTERGSLSVDRLTNTIIMRDISSVLKRAQKLVATLDIKK